MFRPQVYASVWEQTLGWQDRLFSTATGEVYVGLLDKIVAWAKSDYSVKI